ncbi:MAG: right-handed parallel beta-helix repeat-containing protein, partial [Myxococcota bacterium]
MTGSDWTAIVGLLLAACAGGPDDDKSSAPADADTDTDTDTDSDTDSDADTDPPGIDADHDGSVVGADCDDVDPDVFPGAPDVCGDRRVTDCDRTSDDGLVTVDGLATFTDLQLALDAAVDGSDVLVCPGTYVGSFTGGAVDLASLDGAAVTVLDAGPSDGLQLAAGSTLTGLTVRGASGAGIRQTSAGTSTITDCIVTGNHSGGIVTAAQSTVAITGTTIEGNRSDGRGGGVVVATRTSVDLTGSVVRDNDADRGGGLFVDVDGVA